MIHNRKTKRLPPPVNAILPASGLGICFFGGSGEWSGVNLIHQTTDDAKVTNRREPDANRSAVVEAAVTTELVLTEITTRANWMGPVLEGILHEEHEWVAWDVTE